MTKILDDATVQATKEEIIYGRAKRGATPMSSRAPRKDAASRRPARGAPSRVSFDPMKSAVLATACRSVPAGEGGEAILTPAREALLMAQLKSGLGGHVNAQEYLLRRVEKIEAEQVQESAAENQLYETYVSAMQRLLAEAREASKPEPECVPHPDDIIIVPGERVRIIGPQSEAQLEYVRHICALRDALLIQEALESRDGCVERSPLILAFLIDRLLPPRFRLDEIKMALFFSKLQKVSRRALAKQVRAAWRGLGCQARRGAKLPPWAKFEPIMLECLQLACDTRRNRPKRKEQRGLFV